MWLRYLVKSIAYDIASVPLSYILPRYAEMRGGPCDNNNQWRIEPRLPEKWSNFMTTDNSLWGDAGWRERNPDYQSVYKMGAWLRRNPAQGLDAGVLAAHIKPTDKIDVLEGDPKVSDAPHGLEGRCFVQVGRYWNLVKVTRFPWKLKGYCWKTNIGWELKTYAEDPTRLTTQPIARFAASTRPTKFVQE